MDPIAFDVVYVDRRANGDRVAYRSGAGIDRVVEDHDAVDGNTQILLSTFLSVSICTSAQSCISTLSDLDTKDPNPVLLLIAVPTEPQTEEEHVSHDGRHDSGVATGPADLLGLPLLKSIYAEIENTRLSASIIPVALLIGGDESRPVTDQEVEPRELQCIDCGAWDVLKSPLSKQNVRTLHLHCYRARRTVYKGRKRSWVGIDEPKGDDYSYLREKMVRELMLEICCPKWKKVSSTGGRIRIPNPRATAVAEAVGRWDFSAHDFSDDELIHGALVMFEHAFTMPQISEYVISSDGVVDFLFACRAAYNDQVPYHNFRHVVDVLQAIFIFMLQLGVLPPIGSQRVSQPSSAQMSLSKIITPLDALTLLVVAVGHDVGHPGVNNAFLVTLKAPLAQLYNDKSVLESFHCAAFSQVLGNHWPKMLEQRKMIIDMILATDMGLHFDFMGKLDKLRKKYEKEGGSSAWDEKLTSNYRTLLCALIIKCADISNVARKHECSEKWAIILIEEFARQANIENDLKIPSSLVAPPVTGSIIALAKSQVGFMNLFAIPLFDNLSKVLPEMKFSVTELVSNKNMWSRKIEESSAPQSGDQASLQRQKGPSPPPPTQSVQPASHQATVPGRHHHLPPVLGTALMEADIPASDAEASVSGSDIRSGITSPRPSESRPGAAVQRAGNGNATAVTVHSTEHLRAGAPSVASYSPDRPRSSPPDLGDCSDHSCSKGCCSPAVIPSGTVERRSSRFFKKVMLWKGWRKESSDG